MMVDDIEQRIKGLVDMLNNVPYIETFSSCEGHYDSDDPDNHRAEVRMYVADEPGFLELSTRILAETAPDWGIVLVEMYKRFYVLPDETELREHYMLTIKPFDRNESIENKRQYTNEAIGKIIGVLTEYLL